MSYNAEKLKNQALETGFTNSGELNVKALVFMPEVRDMCRADRCKSYGKSWKCPPGCGTLEESAEMVKGYSFGMIVQTVGNMEDDFDYETIEDTAKKHKHNLETLIDTLKEEYPDILPMGAGTCGICKTCTYPEAPCRFPEKAIGSMEAYGLWVSRVCELSGIPYNYGKQTIAYTSCYLLK